MSYTDSGVTVWRSTTEFYSGRLTPEHTQHVVTVVFDGDFDLYLSTDPTRTVGELTRYYQRDWRGTGRVLPIRVYSPVGEVRRIVVPEKESTVNQFHPQHFRFWPSANGQVELAEGQVLLVASEYGEPECFVTSDLEAALRELVDYFRDFRGGDEREIPVWVFGPHPETPTLAINCL